MATEAILNGGIRPVLGVFLEVVKVLAKAAEGILDLAWWWVNLT